MPSSYVIGEHFEQFIKGQIQQGRYASASEVIRDGLRVPEDREKLRALKLEALRADIQQGINSGPGRPIHDVAARLQARYQQWAPQGPLLMKCELSPQAEADLLEIGDSITRDNPQRAAIVCSSALRHLLHGPYGSRSDRADPARLP